MRGVSTCAVFLDNCRVPAANLLGGEEGRGFGLAMKTLVSAASRLPPPASVSPRAAWMPAWPSPETGSSSAVPSP